MCIGLADPAGRACMEERVVGLNGLIKDGEVGLIGLMGCRSGMPGWMKLCRYRAHSVRESAGSSTASLNQSVVGPESFELVSPAVRLDLLLRSLSAAGSGNVCMVKVGRIGPCLRCASI